MLVDVSGKNLEGEGSDEFGDEQLVALAIIRLIRNIKDHLLDQIYYSDEFNVKIVIPRSNDGN